MPHRPVPWHAFSQRDLALDAQALRDSFTAHLEYTLAKDETSVTRLDFYRALAYTVRDRLLDRYNHTQQVFLRQGRKRVYYLSLEYLLGRLLRDGLLNLGLHEAAREALADFEIELDRVCALEWDAGLGNGGLGRLAACFLDSMATLGLPAMGYGLRYDYGIFRQAIEGGEQVEAPDHWLRYGNPWEIPRPDCIYPIRLGGAVEVREKPAGGLTFEWQGGTLVMAMAHDLLVPGFQNGVVNALRLWSARASREFDLENFNRGDYLQAVYEKNATENITRVLYPSDSTVQGRELRLVQEYFFVSASLQDALKRHVQTFGAVGNLAEQAVFQLNDTHPSLAIPELMRLLLDEHGLDWDEAWTVTTGCMAYTNHTVMPEALEHWPVAMLERLLPRHLQIIYEINARFLDGVRRRWPRDPERVARMSLIEEGHGRRVRMANLCVVGSRSVNGVSELHTGLLRTSLFHDFAEETPQKFNAKTNGITPRRWLLGCNPRLAAVLTEHLGAGWPRDLTRLAGLEPLARDAAFQARWRAVKRANREDLGRLALSACDVVLDPDALCDVQVKRIHEYKRQLLNALWLVARWQRIRRGETQRMAPRSVVFAGKAAPAYQQAKDVIRLINAAAAAINADPTAAGLLRVCFVPDYSVSVAERIIPAADLSQQISTAGTEASGTGNMKLALNGALTLGTLDGANLEILAEVGADGVFSFGLDEPGVRALRAAGYRPRDVVEADPELGEVLALIKSGALTPDQPDRLRGLVHGLLDHDHFLVLADFSAYREAQERVDRAWRDPGDWTRRSILTVARMGAFSSDATIRRYASEIWGIEG